MRRPAKLNKLRTTAERVLAHQPVATELYTSRIDTGEPYEYPPGSRVLVIDVASGEAKNYDY